MPRKRSKKIFYGWWMIIAFVILNVFSGGTFVYGFTAFFNPMRQTFGWTAAMTSVAFVFQRVEQGILSPIVGFLVDKVGPRKMLLYGWGILGLGFLLMSHMNSLWSYYGSFLVMATGFGFGSFLVMSTVAAHWFIKKRSRAITMIYVGLGLSGILVPLVNWFIIQFGWRESAVFIALILWVIGIPLSSLVRHKPAPYGYLPDGETVTAADVTGASVNSSGHMLRDDSVSTAADFTAREAMRTPAFWYLAVANFFVHLAPNAVTVHIIPYLESVRFSTEVAATVVMAMTLCSLIGRLGFGFLGDFVSKRHLLAVAILLEVIGVYIYSFIDVDKMWLVILSLPLYTIGYGGALPLKPALQADYYGVKYFGTIMGLMSSISLVGGMFSPVLAGWLFDVTGTYRLAWRILALVTLPAIPLALLAKPPKPASRR